MDKLSVSTKCVNCKNVLDSPVLLPCGDSICKKHTLNCHASILCFLCDIEHPIPANGGFTPIKALAGVIDSRVTILDFGKEHKQAKQSCENFDDLLTKIERFLEDPYNFTYEPIDYLKNMVQLKGEEMILEINEKMHGIQSKLDDYKKECQKGFGKKKYVVKAENWRLEKNEAHEDLKKWMTKLNEIKFNENEWKRIRREIEKAIEIFENKLTDFKNYLFPKKFELFRAEIEKEFGKFEIDPAFDLM